MLLVQPITLLLLELLIFKVLGKGESQVYVEYSQPWDGGEKDVWTYEMLVTVK